MSESLFSFITPKLSIHCENIATEALNFILNKKYKIISKEFVGYLNNRASSLFDEEMVFSTQVTGNDGSRPDIIGKDEFGREVLIIEAKFWAGLTDNQPNSYWKRLPDDIDCALIFLVPKQRFGILINEIKYQLNNIGISVSPADEIYTCNNFYYFKFGKKYLILISWGAVLEYLHDRANDNNEKELASDISQLQSLCVKMDEVSFLPLSSEEVSSSIARRLLQYQSLVDELANAVVTAKMASYPTDARFSGSSTLSQRPIRIHEYGCYIQFNTDFWSKYAETPLWLIVKDKSWQYSSDIEKKLHKLKYENPSRLIKVDGQLYIPLRLLINSDKDGVIANLVDQIKEVYMLLA